MIVAPTCGVLCKHVPAAVEQCAPAVFVPRHALLVRRQPPKPGAADVAVNLPSIVIVHSVVDSACAIRRVLRNFSARGAATSNVQHVKAATATKPDMHRAKTSNA